MNVLFTTQSESLAVFDALRDSLARRGKINRAGFVVADRTVYDSWIKQNTAFEGAGHLLVKEWDITIHRGSKPDMEKLARYEKELGGEAGLFGALVADRRIFMGKDCTYAQDYRRRFADEELWSILLAGIEAVERLFDELKPNFLVGFISVTFLDYIAYLFARARGVRVLNLRPTRVGDRVGFFSTLNDPSPEFIAAYRSIREGRTSPFVEEARAYIQRVREKHGRYEGVVAPSEKPALKIEGKRSPFRSLLRVVLNCLRYRFGPAHLDNHVADPLRMVFFGAFLNPLRARITARYLSPVYLGKEDLGRERYVFFPLHTEPEVSLLVYGRPYVNQIEIVRMLAMSLPADMVLVIKEHPWMVGKRTLGAYKKILNIPRVRIARPSLDARDVIAKARGVAVVTGSIALEAAMLGKPVLTFGDCPYNALPLSMVRRCTDPRRLPAILRELLSAHTNDEEALSAYLAATFETSAPVNLYSVLLKKRGVYTERDTNFDAEVEALCEHLLSCLEWPKTVQEDVNSAADW